MSRLRRWVHPSGSDQWRGLHPTGARPIRKWRQSSSRCQAVHLRPDRHRSARPSPSAQVDPRLVGGDARPGSSRDAPSRTPKLRVAAGRCRTWPCALAAPNGSLWRARHHYRRGRSMATSTSSDCVSRRSLRMASCTRVGCAGEGTGREPTDPREARRRWPVLTASPGCPLGAEGTDQHLPSRLCPVRADPRRREGEAYWPRSRCCGSTEATTRRPQATA